MKQSPSTETKQLHRLEWQECLHIPLWMPSKSGAKSNGQKRRKPRSIRLTLSQRVMVKKEGSQALGLLCHKESWSEKKEARYLAYFVTKSTGSKKEAKYLAIRDRRSQKIQSLKNTD